MSPLSALLPPVFFFVLQPDFRLQVDRPLPEQAAAQRFVILLWWALEALALVSMALKVGPPGMPPCTHPSGAELMPPFGSVCWAAVAE